MNDMQMRYTAVVIFSFFLGAETVWLFTLPDARISEETETANVASIPFKRHENNVEQEIREPTELIVDDVVFDDDSLESLVLMSNKWDVMKLESEMKRIIASDLTFMPMNSKLLILFDNLVAASPLKAINMLDEMGLLSVYYRDPGRDRI